MALLFSFGSRAEEEEKKEVEDVEEVVMTRSGRRVRGCASTRRRQQQGSADRIVCFDYEDELGMPGHR